MKALQDNIPDNNCYGCGAENPHGMQIKSYWDGEVSRCSYTPKPEQCAGPPQFLYGGTIASLIDCHCVGTAIAAFYEKEGRHVGDGPQIWCVTGRLTVNYLKPTPIDRPVELRATVEEIGEKKALMKCTMYSDGEATAEGDVIAIRVPDSWRD